MGSNQPAINKGVPRRELLPYSNATSTSDCVVMDTVLIHRRKQFSSCDACRKSRVACNAMRGRSARGMTSVATCTRCATRNRSCTFEVEDPLSINYILTLSLSTVCQQRANAQFDLQWMNRATIISNSQALSSDRRGPPPTPPTVYVDFSLIPRQRSPVLSSFAER